LVASGSVVFDTRVQEKITENSGDAAGTTGAV